MYSLAFTFTDILFLKINFCKDSTLSSCVSQLATLVELREGAYKN